MSNDPVLDSLLEEAGDLFGDEKPEYEGPYGIGTWPEARLTDVETVANHDYGYKLTLHFNLKGDSMKFKSQITLPRTIEENGDANKYEFQLKREEGNRAVVNRILAGAGSPKTLKRNVDDDDTYQQVAGVFRGLVGNPCPIKVREDSKNVFTPDENGTATNRDGVKGTWSREGTGFTRIDGIKARRRK